jgi:superfamily II DNA/RNA helicase
LSRNGASESIEQKLLFVNEKGKLATLRNLINEVSKFIYSKLSNMKLQGLRPPVLIFVEATSRAIQLSKELLYDGVNVGAIYPGLAAE